MPKATVPVVTGLPPELVSGTVTFSHQRRSSSSADRCDSPTVSRAGSGVCEGCPGREGGEPGEAGEGRGGFAGAAGPAVRGGLPVPVPESAPRPEPVPCGLPLLPDGDGGDGGDCGDCRDCGEEEVGGLGEPGAGEPGERPGERPEGGAAGKEWNSTPLSGGTAPPTGWEDEPGPAASEAT
ncbi:hypothetical protein GCM10010324_43730 [Streptomyces hiroshimensis]|uniref:Uncharacterized protein n=1 Tax=Streptomyces hiroshimensis TaxID=66424 RepID=A0ABQ2YT50_9ACTN|nr:hypothetical protein GCM10010324_43730 [Streptomyces hiroshimensis]